MLLELLAKRRRLNAEARVTTGVKATRPVPYYPAAAQQLLANLPKEA